jgi:hypothetical protein
VDPDRCTRFAGYAGVDDQANTLAYDYCASEAPTLAPRGGGCAPERMPQWGQCGGKSNCTAWGCADAAWPGACCAPGLECARIDAYYYQCVLPSVAVAIAAGSSGLAPEAGAATQPAVAGAAADAQQAASTAATTTSSVVAALPSLQPKAAGETVYVRLRINYPYDLISSDVGAQARLKSDLTGWLRAHAAPAQYVYAAGAGRRFSGRQRTEGRAGSLGVSLPTPLCLQQSPQSTQGASAADR